MNHDFLCIVQYLQKMYKYSEAVVRLEKRGENRLKNQTSWKLEEEKHTYKERVKWFLLYCIILYL